MRRSSDSLPQRSLTDSQLRSTTSPLRRSEGERQACARAAGAAGGLSRVLLLPPDRSLSYPQRETGFRSTSSPTSPERPTATLTFGLPALITSSASRDQRHRAHSLSGRSEDTRPSPLTPHLLDAQNPNPSPVLLVRSSLTPAYQPRVKGGAVGAARAKRAPPCSYRDTRARRLHTLVGRRRQHC